MSQRPIDLTGKQAVGLCYEALSHCRKFVGAITYAADNGVLSGDAAGEAPYGDLEGEPGAGVRTGLPTSPLSVGAPSGAGTRIWSCAN